MARFGAALMVAATCAMLALVQGLYQDQAGDHDWLIENVGRVEWAVYGGDKSGHASSSARGTWRSLFVASDKRSRAIARLDSKTGAIKWRRVLSEGDDIDMIELTDFGLLSVSSFGKNVRLWDANDGTLLWDSVMWTGYGKSTFGYALSVGDYRAIFLSSSFVTLASLKDGSEAWSAPYGVNLESIVSVQLASTKSKVFLLGPAKNAQLSVVQLVTIDVGSRLVDYTEIKLADEESVVLRSNEKGEAVLVRLSPKEVVVEALEDSGKRKKSTAVARVTPDNSQQFDKIETLVKNALVITLSSGERVYCRVTESLAVELLTTIPSDGMVVEASSEELTLLYLSQDTEPGIRLTAYTSTGKQDALDWHATIGLSVFGRGIDNVFASCPSRKKESGPSRCRALLLMKDESLVMSSNEEGSELNEKAKGVMWVREEALANIKEVHWITPPDAESEIPVLKGLPSYQEELQIEVQRLKQLFNRTLSFSKTLFAEKKKSRGRKEPENAQFFGFNKDALVLTESGRIYALRVETQSITWSAFAGPDSTLLVTRSHPAFESGAEVVLVMPSPKTFVWIDGKDGTDVEGASVPSFGEVWVVPLPKKKNAIVEKGAPRRAIAVIAPDSLDVSIFPKENENKVLPEAEDFFFHRFDEVSNGFKGYNLDRIDGEEITYHAREVWSVIFPKAQEVVATTHQPKGVVDSPVTITGDDSLLLKYLNSHMFAVATVSEETQPGESSKSSILHVNLIDAVSGRVVHRVQHVHGSLPVQMVQSENWVVYSYWNSKEKRTELVSMSLYEGAIGTHGLNPWSRPTLNPYRSSFDPRAPFVLQRSFVFPSKIETLSVTVTKRGITPQYVLVGMKNGQLLKLPRQLIDPRQPDKAPTPQEQEEGLVQYTPLVPMYNILQSMVTYNKSIANLKAISTAPVELESTTLVFAHGLDIFYARIAPAKAFDVLPSDFNYELLVLLCLVFFVATALTKMLAQRKALNEAWK